jgi:hypothetical protein
MARLFSLPPKPPPLLFNIREPKTLSDGIGRFKISASFCWEEDVL